MHRDPPNFYCFVNNHVHLHTEINVTTNGSLPFNFFCYYLQTIFSFEMDFSVFKFANILGLEPSYSYILL